MKEERKESGVEPPHSKVRSGFAFHLTHHREDGYYLDKINTYSLAKMHLDDSPSDEQILAFVEAWIDDLARGDYQAAYARTAHDPYYAWTPNLIQAVIEGFGLPEPRRDGKVFHVTERHLALGECHDRIVDREYAEVRYNLPLNGEWSDLTATFRIEHREGGSVVILQEIHVF